MGEKEEEKLKEISEQRLLNERARQEYLGIKNLFDLITFMMKQTIDLREENILLTERELKERCLFEQERENLQMQIQNMKIEYLQLHAKLKETQAEFTKEDVEQIFSLAQNKKKAKLRLRKREDNLLKRLNLQWSETAKQVAEELEIVEAIEKTIRDTPVGAVPKILIKNKWIFSIRKYHGKDYIYARQKSRK